jgi:broad specificity phosphatase PhoE
MSNRQNVWLVRHGESAANVGEATSDHAAIPLTDLGRAQAAAVASTCAETPDWIGHSPYLRARQTAAPLIARYPTSSVVELAVQEFTYLAPHRCLNMNASARQPLVEAYWSRMDPDFCDGGGAESFVALFARVDAFLKIAAEREGFAVVFSHEQFIRAVLVAVMYPKVRPNLDVMRRFWALRAGMPIPNAAVVRLQRDAERWWVGGVDVSHLQKAFADASR